MSGKGDERAERILAQAVAAEPKDILGLLRALRRDMPAPLARAEGAVHALVQRMLREGSLAVAGTTEAGLVRYRAPDDDARPSARVEAGAEAADPALAALALKLSRAVRDPADRGRVLADVRAHLEELAAAGAPERFGRPKVVATLLQRVDRGKAAVLLPDGGADLARRFVLHEGPWILGAAVVFVVLKLWVVSPFKIPSESMLPTLETGDRVAVFTLFKPEVPERFDVIVYDRGDVHYVKRLIGLPGESLALWRGDVYVDGLLLRKPDWLVASLRSHVGSWRFEDEAPAGFASMDRDGMRHWWWRSGRFTAHPRGSVSFGMHDGFAVLTGRRAAGETIELILAHGPAGMRAEGRGWVLRLDDTGASLFEREGLDLTAGAPGAPDQDALALGTESATGAVRLELAYVDGVLRARAPGLTYAEPRASPSGDLSVGLGRSAGAAGALELVLDRDHHWSTPRDATHGTPVDGQRRAHRVPEDSVFCMGDNTTNSRDSRFSQVGDIPLDAIVGPVSVRIWPPTRWGRVR